MAVSHLTTVSDNAETPPKGSVVEFGRGGPESAAWRIRQLQYEAHALAREQIESFARDLSAMAARAAEISAGGEAYAVGARDLASRLAEDLTHKAQLLLTLVSREG